MPMKRVIESLLSVLALSFCVQSQLAFAGVHPAETRQEFIVVYHSEESKQAALEGSSGNIQHEFNIIPAVTAALTNAEAAGLKADPNIALIEPNITLHLADADFRAVSVPEEQSYWNFQAIQPNRMWNEGFTGAGVKVAVIDSGIFEHPELSVAGGVSTVDYTDSYSDDNGHGTHVAGIIAAKNNGKATAGIAPDVQLYAVKAMDQHGDGTLQDVLEGFEWAIEHDMDLINLSLGTPEASELLREMTDRAYKEGIIVVGAAGNDQEGLPIGTPTVTYPAKYDSVIAVAALDASNARGYFSSVGAEVEVASPGVDIVSTYVDESGNDGYAIGSGTSQAAPHVTGMMALLKQKYPFMTNAQLREEVIKYAVDLGDPGRDVQFGYGAVTFRKAVAPPSFEETVSLKHALLDNADLGKSSLSDEEKRLAFQRKLDALQEEWGMRELPAKSMIRSDVPVSISLELAAKNANYKHIDESSVIKNSNVFVLNSKGQLQEDAVIDVVFNRIVVAAPFQSDETYTLIIDSTVSGKPSFTSQLSYKLNHPLMVTFSAAKPAAFKASKTGAWYDETVKWGLANGIVTGYEDGSFKPNKTVNEAEFLTMLLRAFEPTIAPSSGGKWADPYYARAKELHYPVKSYTSLGSRNITISREQVAELISSTEGVRFSGVNAIHYLLAFGLAEGKQSMVSIEGFAGEKQLTRAEALQFVKNVKDYGIGGLLKRPNQYSDIRNLPALQ